MDRILAGLFFAIVGSGVFGVCWVEAVQIWRDGTTLSQITAGLIEGHTFRAGVALFVAGGITAFLLVHFTNTWRLWRP